MHEHIVTPNYPNVVWAFPYRGVQIELTTTMHHGQQIYSVWVTHEKGSAVAVPRADSRDYAIAAAKKWVNTHFSWSQ